MKILTLLVLLIISSNLLAETQSQSKVIDAGAFGEESNIFFAMRDNFLISNYRFSNSSSELDKLESEMELWKSISVNSLAQFGIQQNSTIQFVNYSTGKLSKYTFKEKVNVIMIRYSDWISNPDYQGSNPRNISFYILLDDVIPKNKDLNFSNQEEPNGIAYNGKEFKLKSALLSSPPLKIKVNKENEEVKKIVNLYNDHYKLSFSSEGVDSSQSNNFPFFHFWGKYKDKTHARFLAVGLKNDKFAFFSNENYYQGINFIEEAEWSIVTPSDDVGSCYTLFIYKNSKIYAYDFYCMRESC